MIPPLRKRKIKKKRGHFSDVFVSELEILLSPSSCPTTKQKTIAFDLFLIWGTKWSKNKGMRDRVIHSFFLSFLHQTFAEYQQHIRYRIQQWAKRGIKRPDHDLVYTQLVTLEELLIPLDLNCLLLFSCQVMSDSLCPHGLQHARPPCPSSSLRFCSNSCPLHQWERERQLNCLPDQKKWKGSGK